MNATWLQQLESRGLSLDPETGVLSADTQAAADATLLVPLTHQRVLRVSGPDSEKFLQGQLSCDLGAVNRFGCRLGAHCNIKGHMISLFRVMRQAPNSYWLRTSSELADKALAGLKKYIIFSKAQAELDTELVGLGLSGPGAAELAAQLVSTLPTETDAATSDGERLLVRVPGARYECWLPASEACALLDSLAGQAQLAGTDTWLLEEIHAGVADLRASTSEAFIPQMTNLQAYEGVSFSKGCYTGQEVVTRLQHRGILKKPMYRAQVHSATRPQPGAPLHTEAKEDVGQVVLAAPCGEQRYELLAVINKEQAETATIHLETQQGPVLELLELPYTLDPRLFESKR